MKFKLKIADLIFGFLEMNTVNATELQPFLETYCIRCHGAEKQKGDRRFDHVTADLSNVENAEAMQEILDQLNLAERAWQPICGLAGLPADSKWGCWFYPLSEQRDGDSRNHFANNVPVKIGQPHIAPGVAKRELFVIQA